MSYVLRILFCFVCTRQLKIRELRSCDKEEVDNFKNACGVNKQKDDKPNLLAAMCRSPERKPLPDKAPHDNDKKTQAKSWSPRRHSHAETRTKVIHMQKVYPVVNVGDSLF